jgi:intracellular multiplication protein IcmP
MAGGARNDPNQNPNSEANILVTVFVVAAILLLMWWKASGYLVYGFFGIAWGELMLAKYLPFVGLGPRGLGALELVEGTLRGRYDAWNVPFAILMEVKHGTGEKLAFVITGAIAALGMLCYHRMAGAKFTNGHTMATLLNAQAEFWGTLAVSAAFNPDKATKNWDQSMRPTDWLRENKIALTKESGLDETACRKVLESHLGEVWNGLEPETPLHVRALMVIFGLHFQFVPSLADKKKTASLQLREDLARSYAATQGGPEFEKAMDELTKDWANDKRVMDAIENVTRPVFDPKTKTTRGGFAYTNTALCEMLSACRKQRGVLASAEILWVKGVDRTLHYCLNNVGRRAFHVESAGAISHWHSEKVVDQALVEPHVDEALVGVKTYFEDHHLGDLEAFFAGPKETKPEWQV